MDKSLNTYTIFLIACVLSLLILYTGTTMSLGYMFTEVAPAIARSVSYGLGGQPMNLLIWVGEFGLNMTIFTPAGLVQLGRTIYYMSSGNMNYTDIWTSYDRVTYFLLQMHIRERAAYVLGLTDSIEQEEEGYVWYDPYVETETETE